MKIKTKSKILVIIAVLTLIAVAGFVLATHSKVKNTDVVTREYSSVYFEPVGNDSKKIDVYLGMKDVASVSGFQIGLKIDIADCYDSEFDWSTGDLKNEPENGLREARITEKEKDEEAGNLEEDMNLYYVGTTELNKLENNDDIDHIKIGTINIIPAKDENKNDVPARSSYVNIQTRDDGFSKTESLSYESENIKVVQDTAYTGNIVVKQSPYIEQLLANVEAYIDEEANKEGAKIVVDFEIKDETNTLTSLIIEVIDENGNVKYTKTISDIKNIELPIIFNDVEEGTYTVQIKGSYTLDNNETYSDVLLKKSDAVIVKSTDEPTNPPVSQEPTDPNNPNNPSDSNDPSKPTEPSNPNNPSDSNDNTTKPNNETNPNDPTQQTNSIVPEQDNNNNNNNDNNQNDSNSNKFLSFLNTGANHSLTRFILPLVILVIIVFVILYIKSRIKAKNSKH